MNLTLLENDIYPLMMSSTVPRIQSVKNKPVLIGYFDWLVIALLIGLNVKYRNRSISFNQGCLVGLIIFGFVLPIISITVEFRVSELQRGPMVDAFTMAYTYFRFPLYWILFLLQGAFLSFRNRVRNEY